MDVNTRNRTDLKAYFVKNAIPTESNFAELIDGMINQNDDGLVKLPDNPLSIEAAGESVRGEPIINFYRNINSTNPDWVLSLNPLSDPDDPNSGRSGFNIGDGQGNSRLFIDAGTGKVGIGTTNAQARLQVINAPQDANGDTLILGPTTAANLRMGYHSDYSWIQSHGGKPLAINPLGNNVAIGKPIAADKLDIYDGTTTGEGGITLHRGRYARLSIVSDNYWSGIELRRNAGGEAGRPHIDFTNDLTTNFGVRISAPTNDALAIEGGNVGIGTSSPQHNLQIGNASSSVSLSLRGPDNASASSYLAFEDNAGTGQRWFKLTHDTRANRLVLSSAEVSSIMTIRRTTGVTSLRQEGWRNVSFQNGWVNYSSTYNTAAYFKDSQGIVHLKGLVKNGTLRRTIFNLPGGYRPARRELQIACTHPNVTGRVDIHTNGNVEAYAGNPAWLSLDGITFRAA